VQVTLDQRRHVWMKVSMATQNAQVESLNGKIRDELFNAHTFTTIFEARRGVVDWRQNYNEVRPHSALGYRTPREFADEFKLTHPHSYQLRKTPPQVSGMIRSAIFVWANGASWPANAVRCVEPDCV
jgi:hypothetical protein